MMHWTRFALAIAAPLMLLGCVLTPGKFVSTLRIDADRSFAFTYVGEVIAVDPGSEFSKGMAEGMSDDTDDDAEPEGASFTPIAQESPDDQAAEAAAKAAETEAKNKAIAETLSKEAGYRKVEYLGDNKFMIDYAITGRLTHNFIYPFNTDAQVVIPFIAIELRANDTVRVTAPAFANQTQSPVPGPGSAASTLDGTFTLSTDAEIVSQNNEDGAKTEGARKVIGWRATPLSKTAPMAVLKLAK